jgi:hypothetical protein
MASKDSKTAQYLRAWGSKDTPTGVLTDGKVRPGTYPAFAVMGWTEELHNRWPAVVLRLALMQRQSEVVIGGMFLYMPFSPRSERHVCATLERLGWDGRIWPHKDHGWPEGHDEEGTILELLQKAELGATLTFPNDPNVGIPAIPIYVGKRVGCGTFHTAPYHEAPMPKHLETIRQLTKDNSPFSV